MSIFSGVNNPGVELNQFTTAQYLALLSFSLLTDPNADRLLGWDDTDNGYKFFVIGTGLTYTHATHTLSASGSGTGDVAGPASATDNAIVRFDGTTGKLIQDSVVTIADTTGNTAGMGTLGVGAITSTGLLTVSLAGNAASFTNTTDAASNQALILESDRATPANGDGVHLSFKLSDSAGNQDESGRIRSQFNSVTSTTESSQMEFSVVTGGTLATEVILTSTALFPAADGGNSLGTTANGWQNLFANTGFVFNIEGGNWVATHTSGILTVGTGDLRVTTAGTNTASVVTVGGTQTLTAKTLTSPTITTSPTAAGATWTDLGTVTTADINGGTLDGVIIGGASAAAATVTTLVVNTSALPDANDGAVLGAAGTAWSDLFLAEGAVINWDSGDATITQTSNDITIAGITTFGVGTSTAVTLGTIELGSASDTTIARVSAGLISVEGVTVVDVSTSQTLTNKTLTSPVLTTPSAFTTGGTITLAENTTIALDPAGSADGKFTGITVTGTAGTTLAFGDLIYLAVADSRWELTDADAVATAGTVLIGMCVLAAAADGSATNVLLQGIIRADAKFPTLTVGAAVYAGETAGAIQVAIPTGADNVIRVVGFALTADEMYLNPSQDHQTTVA